MSRHAFVFTFGTILAAIAVAWLIVCPASPSALILVNIAIGAILTGFLLLAFRPNAGRHRGRFPYARP